MWNEKIEAMSRDELLCLQSKRLVETVKRVYDNTPFYRKRMDEQGVLPGDIKSVEDIVKLPFTTKADLRDNYPFGTFSAPMSDIVRVHASSGTTGKQIVVGYTKNDLEVWGDCLARAYTIAGADKNSIIQIAYGYGMFTGGLGAHYGSERIGASTVPASTGNTARQLAFLKDFGVTHIACTPSYAIYLGESMEKYGYSIDDFKLKAGIFGAEPWTEEMRKQIENSLKIKAFDIYGLSEVMGPGVAVECEKQNGLHIWEDNFIPEIVDRNTFKELPDGEEGELVFTCITKEALPLIRYRTKDVSALNHEVCECGRTHARMIKPRGRTDDMLIIRGVNVFPSQIESVLMDFGKTLPHYILVVDRKGVLDTLEIKVEVANEYFSDEVKTLEKLKTEIGTRIQNVLGISAKITLVEPYSIERSEGKAKRIIDNRKLF